MSGRRRVRTSQQAVNRTFIELEIPLEITSHHGLSCTVCCNNFCCTQSCPHSMTRVSCCQAPICCKCLLKLAKRCTCTSDCEQVVAHCPFCRGICSLRSLDMFLGYCRKKCRTCSEAVQVVTPIEEEEDDQSM